MGSDLAAPARLIMLVLIAAAEVDTAVVPRQFSPSLSQLAAKSGLDRSTVARRLNELEDSGWVKRDRPEVADARANGTPTTYQLSIGGSRTARLVAEDNHTGSRAQQPPVVAEDNQGSRTARPNTHQAHQPSSSKRRASTSKKPESTRDDVERVCGHLADRIEANGSKRPQIGQRWRDAARLLIDKDGRTEQQVHNAIDWCQDDEFWRVNVMSMPTLREKYDRLRLAAQRKTTGSRSGPKSTAPERLPPERKCAEHRKPLPCGLCRVTERNT